MYQSKQKIYKYNVPMTEHNEIFYFLAGSLYNMHLAFTEAYLSTSIIHQVALYIMTRGYFALWSEDRKIKEKE